MSSSFTVRSYSRKRKRHHAAPSPPENHVHPVWFIRDMWYLMINPYLGDRDMAAVRCTCTQIRQVMNCYVGLTVSNLHPRYALHWIAFDLDHDRLSELFGFCLALHSDGATKLLFLSFMKSRCASFTRMWTACRWGDLFCEANVRIREDAAREMHLGRMHLLQTEAEQRMSVWMCQILGECVDPLDIHLWAADWHEHTLPALREISESWGADEMAESELMRWYFWTTPRGRRDAERERLAMSRLMLDVQRIMKCQVLYFDTKHCPVALLWACRRTLQSLYITESASYVAGTIRNCPDEVAQSPLLDPRDWGFVQLPEGKDREAHEKDLWGMLPWLKFPRLTQLHINKTASKNLYVSQFPLLRSLVVTGPLPRSVRMDQTPAHLEHLTLECACPNRLYDYLGEAYDNQDCDLPPGCVHLTVHLHSLMWLLPRPTVTPEFAHWVAARFRHIRHLTLVVPRVQHEAPLLEIFSGGQAPPILYLDILFSRITKLELRSAPGELRNSIPQLILLKMLERFGDLEELECPDSTKIMEPQGRYWTCLFRAGSNQQRVTRVTLGSHVVPMLSLGPSAGDPCPYCNLCTARGQH